MISNAVSNMPANSGPVRSGHSGRTSGETGNAFREVLDKSGKTEAETAEVETEAADDTRPRTALADTRWQSTLENMPEEQSVDGEAEADVTGEDLLEGAKGQMEHPVTDAGKPLPDNAATGQDPDRKVQAKTENVEAVAAAAQQTAQAAGVATKAVSANAAGGLARAGEVASENARLPGRNISGDGQPVTDADTAGGTAEDDGAIVAGKRPASALAANSDGGVRKVPAAGAASGQGAGQAASASSLRNPQTDQIAGAGQDARADSGIRVTGDIKADAGRMAGDAAQAATRPSTETAGPAVRTAGFADSLPGTTDTSVSKQVADAVAQELEELAPSRLSLTGSTALGGRAVKAMRLQLNPAELGAINIRMQSVDGELRVTIQADSDHTSRMLHNDTDAIRSALRAVGINGAANPRNDSAQPQNFGAQHRDPSGQQAGTQENRQNASNESRQSYRESSSNDSANSPALGSDAGDNGNGRGRRITI